MRFYLDFIQLFIRCLVKKNKANTYYNNLSVFCQIFVSIIDQANAYNTSYTYGINKKTTNTTKKGTFVFVPWGSNFIEQRGASKKKRPTFLTYDKTTKHNTNSIIFHVQLAMMILWEMWGFLFLFKHVMSVCNLFVAIPIFRDVHQWRKGLSGIQGGMKQIFKRIDLRQK